MAMPVRRDVPRARDRADRCSAPALCWNDAPDYPCRVHRPESPSSRSALVRREQLWGTKELARTTLPSRSPRRSPTTSRRSGVARQLHAERGQPWGRVRAVGDEPRDRRPFGPPGDPRADPGAGPRRRSRLRDGGDEVDRRADPRRPVRLVPGERAPLLWAGRTTCSTRSSGSWPRSAAKRRTWTGCSPR